MPRRAVVRASIRTACATSIDLKWLMKIGDRVHERGPTNPAMIAVVGCRVARGELFGSLIRFCGPGIESVRYGTDSMSQRVSAVQQCCDHLTLC
jgi:hypothetical protein